MNSNRIEGFFLEFSDEEIKGIKEELDARGYSPDGSGMKACLMDFLFAEEEEGPARDARTDTFINTTKDFLTQHPEVIKFGMERALGLLKKARRR